jgi:hypothetical protein
MPWYVLECENGYLGNEFELYNGTARRPRLAVVDLQEASLFAKTKSAKEFSKLCENVIGIGGEPKPVRFEKRKNEAGQPETRIILEQEQGALIS